MNTVKFGDKSFEIDADGFLTDFEMWEEDFASAMAARVKIPGGLTEDHWHIIRYIRSIFQQQGVCPLIYQTCRENKLSVRDLERLFPTGYLRGACLLAGITYREGFVGYSLQDESAEQTAQTLKKKVYQINVWGFLIDPYEWDEHFAFCKAREMKMPPLTDEHWRIIGFLRDYFRKNYRAPTVYETCEANGLEISDLERLFPDGYHRGAIKVAGLRVR